MFVRSLCLSALVLLLSCETQAQVMQSSAKGSVNQPHSGVFTANTASTGYTISSDFVGYSLNTSAVINGQFSGSGSACSLAGLLGTNGVLRIGGVDQDTTPTAPALTQGIANGLESFRSCLGSGWKILYGLDLNVNSPSTAATQAQMLQTASGSNMIFQFGNEPVDGGTWNFSTYPTVWNSYYSAVNAVIPSAKYAAWDDQNYNQAQNVIPNLTIGLAGLQYVTQHYYDSPCSQSLPPAQLISQALQNLQQPTGLASIGIFQNVQWAAAAGIKTRMSESNSICGGGGLGASNLLMSSTWFLNMSIMLANNGFSGINIHNNTWWPASSGSPTIGYVYPNIYGPLQVNSDLTFSPGPIFYGMYLFSQIEGQQTIALSSNANFSNNAIATKGVNGNANIIVVNNDPFVAANITPMQINSWTTANVLKISTLDGQNCTSGNPIIGGQPIGKSGLWLGSPSSIGNGQSVMLQPCEAALIQILP